MSIEQTIRDAVPAWMAKWEWTSTREGAGTLTSPPVVVDRVEYRYGVYVSTRDGGCHVSAAMRAAPQYPTRSGAWCLPQFAHADSVRPDAFVGALHFVATEILERLHRDHGVDVVEEWCS